MKDVTIEKGIKGVDVRELIKDRVVVFDGAMGTMLQKRGLRLGENPEVINFTNEDTVIDIHKEYIKAGADIINDIWGAKYDKDIAKVAAEYNVPLILMHNREAKPYENLMKDVISDLQESIDIAIEAGVKKENIILDPGIGFAKTYEENLIVMNNCEVIKAMGYPVLLGTSRKSMIGLTLNLPVNERVEGTLATTVMGIMKGMEFIRVHDVLENKRVAVMTDTILKAK